MIDKTFSNSFETSFNEPHTNGKLSESRKSLLEETKKV
jgi:hypothetical protein